MNNHTINSTSILSRCMRCIGTILTAALMMSAVAFSQHSNPAAVPLLTAGTYGALASTGITGSASVNGDGGTLTGTIDGTITFTGTNWGVGTTHNGQAQTDLGNALTNANGRTNDSTITGNELGGLTLLRGVYGGGALNLASGTTLTLDGSATDIFIIKTGSTLTINTNSTVTLIGGAVWSNVFWYVGSSATIFSGATFNGIILAVTSITLNASATSVTSQLLANGGAVTINSNVLPVELTSFTAALNNSAVELNWNTATEVNNYGFEVQRSQTQKNYDWKKIGFVKGAGNSNSPNSYSFTDKNPVGSASFSYRLKQIDIDGNFKYYDAITVSLSSSTNAELMQNSPNPFNPSTAIKFYIPNNTDVAIKIYDIIGREVMTLINNQTTAGYHIVYWNGRDSYGRDAASGVYLYRLTAGNFSETRKMNLLK